MGISNAAWAESEFSGAALGDPRRTRRLIAMAATLAEQPAGRITDAFAQSAMREAAYRFVENHRFSEVAMGVSMRRACANRASNCAEVIVPIDGVTITLPHRGTGFGPVCDKGRANGAQAMTALALSPEGVPLGVLAQVWWTRPTTSSPSWWHDKRPVAERETGHWLTAISQAIDALRRNAPSTKPWLQLDRGGDCADVILHALASGAELTVRACYDRVVAGGRLWGKAASGVHLGTYSLRLQRPGVRGRVVTVAVRSRRVELHLRKGPMSRGPLTRQTMWVVEARERGNRAEKVLWRLLTTKRASTLSEARRVIDGYTLRWRIEEFHLAWKTGACGIEQSRLRDREHFYKWATLAAAVAARLEHIRLLARTQPDIPAADEFSQAEIDATIALRQPAEASHRGGLTIGQMVRWIADLGGYTGPSNGPPGIRVLARGFEKVSVATAAIAYIRKGGRTTGQ